MKQYKLFVLFFEWEQAHKKFKKKKWTFAWSFMYLNEWKHFCRQFFFLLFFSSACIFCLLSYFEISRCFVKSLILHQHIFWWNTTEKRKLEKCFLGTRVFGPKPVYWSPKQPGYITGFMADIKFLKMLSASLQNRIIFYLTWMQNTSKKKKELVNTFCHMGFCYQKWCLDATRY